MLGTVSQLSEIEAILGYSGRGEMIHRDDMAMTGDEGSQQ